MIRELDTVVLTTSLPEFGLEPGDMGAVVLAHRGEAEEGYEVEFVTLDGRTIAVVSLSPPDYVIQTYGFRRDSIHRSLQNTSLWRVSGIPMLTRMSISIIALSKNYL